MTDDRDKFEKWLINDRGLSYKWIDYQGYADLSVQLAYEAWQASAAAEREECAALVEQYVALKWLAVAILGRK